MKNLYIYLNKYEYVFLFCFFYFKSNSNVLLQQYKHLQNMHEVITDSLMQSENSNLQIYFNKFIKTISNPLITQWLHQNILHLVHQNTQNKFTLFLKYTCETCM